MDAQVSSVLNRTTLRRCLSALDQAAELGLSPLCELPVIERRVCRLAVAVTPLERGRELQRFLNECLLELKSAAPSGDGERYYRALNLQYVQGMNNNFVARQMGLSSSSYHRLTGEACDLLLETIRAHCDDRVGMSAGATQRIALLPLPSPARFVGRQTELALIRSRLLAAPTGCGARQVTLVGIGGIGKTELLKQVVHDPKVAAHFPGGVLWAAAGRHADATSILQRWGKALGLANELLKRSHDVFELARLVHGAAVGRGVLFALDDVWPSDPIANMPLGSGDCAFICSTRTPTVALLRGDAAPIRLSALSHEDSLDVLRGYAASVVEAHPEAVAELLAELDGLPLALAMAGQYLQEAAFTAHPRRVTQALDRLRESMFRFALQDRSALLEGVDPAQRTLAAVIGSMVDALGRPERTLLTSLATLPPKPYAFSESAVLLQAESAAVDAPADVLDALVFAGLLEQEGQDQYCMHRVVSEFARAHLCTHADWARMISQHAERVSAGVIDDEALTQELPAFLEAVGRAFRYGHEAHGTTLAIGLAQTLLAHGMGMHAAAMLDQALSCEVSRSCASTRLNLLLARIETATHLCDNAVGNASAQEALLLARQLGDALAQSRAAAVAAQFFLCIEDLDRALPAAQHGFEAALACNDAQQIALARALLNTCSAARGIASQTPRDTGAASCVAYPPAPGAAPTQEAYVRAELAHAAVMLVGGHLRQACEWVTRLVSQTAAQRQQPLRRSLLGLRAWIEVLGGCLDDAERTIAAAADLRSEPCAGPAGVTLEMARSVLAQAHGAFEQAEAHAREAAARAERRSPLQLFERSTVLAQLGTTQLAQGKHDVARLTLMHALDSAERSLDRIAPLCDLARLAAQSGQAVHVRRHLEEAHAVVGWQSVFERPLLSFSVTQAAAESLLMLRRIDDARYYGSEALRYAQRMQLQPALGAAHHVLAQTFALHIAPGEGQRAALMHATRAYEAYAVAGYAEQARCAALCRALTQPAPDGPSAN